MFRAARRSGILISPLESGLSIDDTVTRFLRDGGGGGVFGNVVGLSGVMIMSSLPLPVIASFACSAMASFSIWCDKLVRGDIAELDGVVTYDDEIVFTPRLDRTTD